MTGTAIQLKQVHKYYGRVHALRGLDLEIQPGEIFGFLGPNGAGKTTTIRCMLDMIRPNSGLIRIFGINPQHNPQAVKAKVGYLPGDLKLDEDFTPRNLLKYIRRLRGKVRVPGRTSWLWRRGWIWTWIGRSRPSPRATNRKWDCCSASSATSRFFYWMSRPWDWTL